LLVITFAAEGFVLIAVFEFSDVPQPIKKPVKNSNIKNRICLSPKN